MRCLGFFQAARKKNYRQVAHDRDNYARQSNTKRQIGFYFPSIYFNSGPASFEKTPAGESAVSGNLVMEV
jgi:hypothetical protein